MPYEHINDVGNHPDQGMPEKDIETIQRVAEKRDEIIIFRDTGCWSRPYIEADHPTKPFHIKGKSSNWGPQAGLVPFDAEYSKAISPEDIAKGNQANAYAKGNGYAIETPLELTLEFIQKNLLRNQSSWKIRPINEYREIPGVLIKTDNNKVSSYNVHIFVCWKPDANGQLCKKYSMLGLVEFGGTKIKVYTLPKDGGDVNPAWGRKEWGESIGTMLKDGLLKPLKVMCDPISLLPITGDYDLFAVCPSMRDFNGRRVKLASAEEAELDSDGKTMERYKLGSILDKKLDPALMDERNRSSLDKTKKRYENPAPVKSLTEDAELKYQARKDWADTMLETKSPAEDPSRGNVTPRIEEVIDTLKTELGGRQRVHHNAESGRPNAPGAEDGFPLTVFQPRKLPGLPFRTCIINGLEDLRTYFRTVYGLGYYPPRNSSWDIDKFLGIDKDGKRALEEMLMRKLAEARKLSDMPEDKGEDKKG